MDFVGEKNCRVWLISGDACPIGMPDPKIIGLAVVIALLSSLGAEIYALQWYRPRSWIFHFRFLPLWLHSVTYRSIGLPDPENIDIAAGIALLYSLGAEIYAFQWDRPPSWIFHFRFRTRWLYSVNTCPNGVPDSENIGIAVGIALLSSLAAEIRCGGPLDPPQPFTYVFFPIIYGIININ